MFTRIVHFSIRKKLFVALATLLLLAGGIYSMPTLPIDAVPDITNNQLQSYRIAYTGSAGSGTVYHFPCRDSHE